MHYGVTAVCAPPSNDHRRCCGFGSDGTPCACACHGSKADEGRAAARRAEIREPVNLKLLLDRAQWYRDGCDGLEDLDAYLRDGLAADAADDLEKVLAECDRRARAVEALTMIEMALDNYFSYSPSRRDEKALGALLTARKMAQKALASPAPAAEDGRTP
jgi:hypothetical protein